jgi:hypothetical protein
LTGSATGIRPWASPATGVQVWPPSVLRAGAASTGAQSTAGGAVGAVVAAPAAATATTPAPCDEPGGRVIAVQVAPPSVDQSPPE